MADRMFFIDVSNWQAGLKLASTDAKAVMIKATEGAGYVDPYCDGFVQQAKKLGIPHGTYHFYAGGSGKAEADHYLKAVDGYIGEGILCLDFERNTGNRSEPIAFLERVYERTGIRPVLYISGSVATAGGWNEVAKHYPLWIARWGTSSPGATGPWEYATMWQFTDAHRTGGYSVDGDYFYGDKAAWAAIASGGKSKPQPEPQPQPEPEPESTTETGDEFAMSEQTTQKRSKPQVIKNDGKYHELDLEDNGDKSFGFGGGAYQLDARFVLSDLAANEELMVRVIRFDTDKNKDNTRIEGSETEYWVQGLAGGAGTSHRLFHWAWHVPAPPKGHGRRLRLEAATWADHPVTIDSVNTATWKAPLN